jgi:DNA-binding response OmpR family regulator
MSPVCGSTEGVTVLVLDDHERIQGIWSVLLAAAGLEYIGARDLGSAKMLIGKHHVDVVVIDEHLAAPQEPGSDFAVWLREATDPSLTGMPILACTSDQSPATRERLLAAGASFVIYKPIDARQALLIIETLAQRRVPRAIRREG